jgi:hypothetical protein
MAGIVIVMLGLALSAPGVQAQSSQQSLNLTPLKTSIRTQKDQVNLGNSPVQIFVNTKMTCPTTATKGCTLGMGVVAIVSVDSNGGEVAVNVAVSGAKMPSIDPDSSIQVDGLYGKAMASTFSWMQRQVPTGATVTVNVQAEVTGNSSSGTAYDRTETVTLFKN